MSRSFAIDGDAITDESPPYVIADLSHNHNGHAWLARYMIKAAAACGADAVKLQKRVTLYESLHAKGEGVYADLRKARELTESDYILLRDEATRHGLDFIVTVFDLEALEFLARVNEEIRPVDAIKLASGAVHNCALLDAALSTTLPVILSTGCADLGAVETAMRLVDGRPLALLQCTSQYPCQADAMHLNVIPAYRARFPDTVIGLSSHTTHNDFEPAAYALGARIFEKHFTLSKALGAGDHAMSLEPSEFTELVRRLHDMAQAMGDGVKRFLPCEETARRRLDVTYGKER